MKRVGLFVGIDRYQNGISQLQCAVNDARKLSFTFARAGFSVDFIDNEQCDSNTITKKILSSISGLGKDDIFVFYFSGHSREHLGVHYLAGVNSFAENSLFDLDAFPVPRLVALTNRVPGLNRLFILDCCRSDILANRAGSFVCEEARDIALNSAVSPDENPEIIPPLILNSCSTGQQAFEDLKTNHGYFTKTLISSIENQNIRSFQDFAGNLNVHGTPKPQTVSWNGSFAQWNNILLFDNWNHGSNPQQTDPSKYLLIPKKKEVETLLSSLNGAIPGEIKSFLDAAQMAENDRAYSAALELLENVKPIIEAEIKKKTSFSGIVDLGKGVSLEMVNIPAGSFVMGSPSEELVRWDIVIPHKVSLTKPFWFGKYPVTQREYESVMGENPSHFKGANQPVEFVSWDDAKAFCRKLNELKRDILPSGYQFDLPTEAQWEYACRAGTTTALNSGKNLTSDEGECSNLNEVAWYCKNSGGRTHEVGQKQPNAWGLYDMHGNVFEWCRDWIGYYPNGNVTDPTGPSSGSNRVTRGGSWVSCANLCRSPFRYGSEPSGRARDAGFRLALVPIQ